MSEEAKATEGLKSISEVAQETSIPESTLRYYDSEFSDSLDIKRDPANRRMFDQNDIRQIMYIRRLLKKDKLTVKQVKDRLAVEKDLLMGPVRQMEDSAMSALTDRLDRIERQQELLVKAVEATLNEVRHSQRLLDLNFTRLSLIIGQPEQK